MIAVVVSAGAPGPGPAIYVYASDPDTIQLVESWSDWDVFAKEILALTSTGSALVERTACTRRRGSSPSCTPLHGGEWS